MHLSQEIILKAYVPSGDQVQGITEQSLEGSQGRRQAARARCQGRGFFPFLPPPLSCPGWGWRLREKAPGREAVWAAARRYTPAPGHRGRPAPPAPARCPRLGLPLGGSRAGFSWSPPATVRGGRAVRGAGRRPAGWGALTSPPQRPRAQVRRAVPRGGAGRVGSCGHAPAAGARRPAGGSARAAAGAARSPVPLPRRAPEPAGQVSCAPRHGSLRCVGGPGPRPSLPAAARSRRRSCARDLDLCLVLPSQPAARFSSAPACTSPAPRLLNLRLSLRLGLVAPEARCSCSSNSARPGGEPARLRPGNTPLRPLGPIGGAQVVPGGRRGIAGGPWATFPSCCFLCPSYAFFFHVEFR